jgi:iron complex outermembrane recepter protein
MTKVNQSLRRGRCRGPDVRLAVQHILRQSRHAALVSSATALLLTATEARAQQTAPSTSSGGQEPSLSEIVVTAQRRTQSLQDVPYNISAISGDALRDAGFVSINSLTEVVPGLTNVDEGPAVRGNNNNFILRGLGTNPPGGGGSGADYHNLTVSTVSTYFGDTPVFFQMPMDDLERVEVLRGPQGTLYGSGAEAGTIRFIPKRPEFDEFTGEVSADGSYTDYAPSANGSIHAVLNIPIADHLAFRLVAGEDHLAGFINAVDRVAREPGGSVDSSVPVPTPSIPGDLTSGFVLGPVQKGSNESDQWFARAALRWQPTDAFDAQVGYIHEHTSMAGSQLGSSWPGGPFDTSFGYYPHATVVTRPGCNYCDTGWAPEPFGNEIDLADLVMTVDVGLGTFTSASSVYDEHTDTVFDQTGIFYGTANPPSPASSYVPYYPYNNYPRIASPIIQDGKQNSFVQEFRLVSKPGTRFDYVAGLYYQRLNDYGQLVASIPGITAYDAYTDQPNLSPQGDHDYLKSTATEFTDKAIFGELTYHLTSSWQLTVGARFFWQTFVNASVVQLPLCGAICSADLTNPNGLTPVLLSTPDHNHVKKINTSYDLSPTLKVYATYSEGFRHGGSTGLGTTGPFADPPNLQTFKPDFAKNYELGVKGSLFEHRVNYFADIYRVDLKNFQFDNLTLSALWGAFNGSTARSQGLEFESQMALTEHLSAGIGYAFTKAYVAQTFNILDYPPYALIPSEGGNGQLASLFGGPIRAGTQLPGVSRNVVTNFVDYTLPATINGNTASWVFHADDSYRSSQASGLNSTSIYYYVIPSAFLANARVSLNSPNNVTYSLFIQNITNNPDITGSANDQEFANPYRFRYVGTPRTFGLGIRYQFGRH